MFNILFGVYLSYVMRVHQVHSIVLCDTKSRDIKLHFAYDQTCNLELPRCENNYHQILILIALALFQLNNDIHHVNSRFHKKNIYIYKKINK